MLFLDAQAQTDSFFNSVMKWFTQNGLDAVKKIIIALLVLWIGFKIIKFLKNKLEKAFEKQNLDPSLRPIISNIITIVLKIILIIAIIGYLGIPMSSFVALLGAAGLAVGMALSGTIQNVAGGIIILIFRPFKIGDYIETQGIQGYVETIHIFSTVVRTFDNKIITLPNGTLSGGNIVNHSSKPTRRVEVKIEVASGTDTNLDKIDKDVKEIAAQNPLMLKDPAPSTFVTIGPGIVTIQVWAWCNESDYWKALNEYQRSIYNYVVKENLQCPYTVVGMLPNNNK